MDVEDKQKNTPLAIAMKYKHAEFTTMLIQSKADTSKKINIPDLSKQKDDGDEDGNNNQYGNTNLLQQDANYNMFLRMQNYRRRGFNGGVINNNSNNFNEDLDDTVN